MSKEKAILLYVYAMGCLSSFTLGVIAPDLIEGIKNSIKNRKIRKHIERCWADAVSNTENEES